MKKNENANSEGFDHIFDYNSKLPWLAVTVLVDTALKTWQISFYVYAAVSVS